MVASLQRGSPATPSQAVASWAAQGLPWAGQPQAPASCYGRSILFPSWDQPLAQGGPGSPPFPSILHPHPPSTAIYPLSPSTRQPHPPTTNHSTLHPHPPSIPIPPPSPSTHYDPVHPSSSSPLQIPPPSTLTPTPSPSTLPPQVHIKPFSFPPGLSPSPAPELESWG